MSMELIFESETEIGRCDLDRLNDILGPGDAGSWILCGTTTATRMGKSRMLRIEQRCYLRSLDQPNNVRSQEVVRPELLLEPALSSGQEDRLLVEQLHAGFVQKAREISTEKAWLIDPAVYSAPAPA
jgi:hypothetical protein